MRLKASGRAAHSSFPELGESAIDKLVDALVALRTIPLPEDPILGRTHYTVGLITGGVAPNVVSPSAEAEVMFRTVCDAGGSRTAIAPLEQRVTIEHVLEVPPVRMVTVPGFDSAVFPVHDRHPVSATLGPAAACSAPVRSILPTRRTSGLTMDELEAAIEGNVRIARELLSRTVVSAGTPRSPRRVRATHRAVG